MTSTTIDPKSYPARLRKFEINSRTLASAEPELTRAFWNLHKSSMSDGALDAKTKELIALAISIVQRCDDCIAHHTFDALEAGATREEVADALGVAILMGGGVGVIYASHAIEAVDQFLEQRG